MKFTIKHQPSYSLLHIDLAAGERVKSEAGSMVYMSPGLNIKTQLGGGVLSALARRFLGGESLFLNEYTAGPTGGIIGLAGSMVGDIAHMPLNNKSVLVQAGSYLCSSPAISLKPRFGGLRTLFGGEGLFLLDVSGSGDLFISSYGTIVRIDIDGAYTVDTGHIVAFENTLSFRVSSIGGWTSTLLSGEGIVCKFSGKGSLWIQSRIPSGFINWLTKLLPR